LTGLRNIAVFCKLAHATTISTEKLDRNRSGRDATRGNGNVRRVA